MQTGNSAGSLVMGMVSKEKMQRFRSFGGRHKRMLQNASRLHDIVMSTIYYGRNDTESISYNRQSSVYHTLQIAAISVRLYLRGQGIRHEM